MRMRNKDILKIGAIIVVIFVLVWFFRGFFGEEETQNNDEGRGGVGSEINAVQAFGDLEIENLDGEPEAIEDHEGRPILLTFWEQEDSESQEQLGILDNLLMLLEEDVAFLSVFEPEDREVPYTAVIDQDGLLFREYSRLVTEEELLSDVERLLEREEQ